MSTDSTIIDLQELLTRATVLNRLSRYQSQYPEQYLHIDDAIWRYRQTTGRSRLQIPVVLLPGIHGTGDIFYEQALRLGDELPLILLTPPDIDDPLSLVLGIERFLQQLNYQTVYVAGASLGGYLAQSLAYLFPQRVARLLISNSFIDASGLLPGLPSVAAIAAMSADDVMEVIMVPLLTAKARNEGELRMQIILATLMGSQQSAENLKSRILAMLACGRIGKPPIMDSRIMILDDDQDQFITPAMRQAVRDRFQSARHSAMDGGGHLPAIQCPEKFADALNSLCAGKFQAHAHAATSIGTASA